jgi:biotin transport system substrate-specific component
VPITARRSPSSSRPPRSDPPARRRQALYVALGALGLPSTPRPPRRRRRARRTGGYLLGFLPAAYLIGLAARQGRPAGSRGDPAVRRRQLVIFAFGVPWLAVVADLSRDAGARGRLLPFLLGGLVKAVLAGSCCRARGAWPATGAERQAGPR